MTHMFFCVIALHIQLFYDLAYVVINVVIMLPTSFHLRKHKGAALIFTTCVYRSNFRKCRKSLNIIPQFILCIPYTVLLHCQIWEHSTEPRITNRVIFYLIQFQRVLQPDKQVHLHKHLFHTTRGFFSSIQLDI